MGAAKRTHFPMLLASTVVAGDVVEVVSEFRSGDMPAAKISCGLRGVVTKVVALGDAYIRFPGLGTVGMMNEDYYNMKVLEKKDKG